MPDTPSLPAGSSNSPAPSSIYNRQPPAVPLSDKNSETTSTFPGLPESESSRVELEGPTNFPSSQFTGVMEVPSGGTYHLFPSHQGNLQFGYDCDIATGGRATIFSMSGDSDNRQDEITADLDLAFADVSRHPSVQAVAVATRVGGLTALDRQPSTVDAHEIQSAPGIIPPNESHRSERRASWSPPPPTWDSPEVQVHTCPLSAHTDPQSSVLDHANLIPHPCQPVTMSELNDSTTSATSPCHGNKGLHHPPFPQPPPEVITLLKAESSGDVLSPIFARNSPLVPWALPSEIGHFWSGLFKISGIKVTRTYHTIRCLISLLPPGSNKFTAKPPEYTYSPACLAFLSGMGAWRRGSSPG